MFNNLGEITMLRQQPRVYKNLYGKFNGSNNRSLIVWTNFKMYPSLNLYIWPTMEPDKNNNQIHTMQ